MTHEQRTRQQIELDDLDPTEAYDAMDAFCWEEEPGTFGIAMGYEDRDSLDRFRE